MRLHLHHGLGGIRLCGRRSRRTCWAVPAARLDDGGGGQTRQPSASSPPLQADALMSKGAGEDDARALVLEPTVSGDRANDEVARGTAPRSACRGTRPDCGRTGRGVSYPPAAACFVERLPARRDLCGGGPSREVRTVGLGTAPGPRSLPEGPHARHPDPGCAGAGVIDLAPHDEDLGAARPNGQRRLARPVGVRVGGAQHHEISGGL